MYNLAICLRYPQLVNFLSSLENPDASIASLHGRLPCRQDLIVPCCSSSNLGRSLGSSQEHKIQPLLEIVGLETSSDGGGDLECGLAKRN